MKKWYEDLSDDKSLVIYAVLILGILVILKMDSAEAGKIVLPIITGLFGVAVGKNISNGQP